MNFKKVIKMTTGQKIKIAIKNSKYDQKQVAKLIEVSASTISQWVNGTTEPRMPNLQKLAEVLAVKVSDLLGDNYIEANNSLGISLISTQKLPLLGDIACGSPIEVSQEIEIYIESNSSIAADFCLRCKGDSMIGARIYDGDIVFIRKQDMVDNGEIAAVIIDNEATLKRVQYLPEENILILKAENPKYTDLVYTGEKLDHIRILGKAVSFYSEIK